MNQDEWWIDLIEGELKGDAARDLKRLAQGSPSAKARVRGWRKLREAVCAADPADDLWNEQRARDFFLRLNRALRSSEIEAELQEVNSR